MQRDICLFDFQCSFLENILTHLYDVRPYFFKGRKFISVNIVQKLISAWDSFYFAKLHTDLLS